MKGGAAWLPQVPAVTRPPGDGLKSEWASSSVQSQISLILLGITKLITNISIGWPVLLKPLATINVLLLCFFENLVKSYQNLARYRIKSMV